MALRMLRWSRPEMCLTSWVKRWPKPWGRVGWGLCRTACDGSSIAIGQSGVTLRIRWPQQGHGASPNGSDGSTQMNSRQTGHRP
jgi:hypothetical protein